MGIPFLRDLQRDIHVYLKLSAVVQRLRSAMARRPEILSIYGQLGSQEKYLTFRGLSAAATALLRASLNMLTEGVGKHTGPSIEMKRGLLGLSRF